MKLQIFNTETKHLEKFKPLKRGLVKMYQCGPTVYWNQHIGNMRAMFVSDIVVRTLQHFGYKVKFVRNYTDVGHLLGDNAGDADTGTDRMQKAAEREKVSPEEIAEKYIASFERDIEQLATVPADEKPRATEYIEPMIRMTEDLLEKGFAYSTDLAIYFDVSRAKDYTRLSGQDLSKNIKGSGHGAVSDPNKRNPQDFALWFFKTGEHVNALQTWSSSFESPLVQNGEGFPGWHLECSVMIRELLGDTIDIHLGGIEHVPVHHTNEIAQSEAANDGAPLAKYWMHYEHLLVDGKKMSKSEGTAYILQDIVDRGYLPLVLRYFFLQAHYRSKQNFTWEALDAAKNGLESLYRSFHELKKSAKKVGKVDKKLHKTFHAALADDFNTPKALALVSEVLPANISDENKLATLIEFDSIFGLNIEEESDKFFEEVKVPADIEEMAKQRVKAREAKDYAKSDELRDKISAAGFEIIDEVGGYKILKK